MASNGKALKAHTIIRNTNTTCKQISIEKEEKQSEMKKKTHDENTHRNIAYTKMIVSDPAKIKRTVSASCVL